MIRLVINGQQRQLEAPMTIAGYLRSLALDSEFVAVAHNGHVLRKEQLGRVTLSEGDQVEIVRPVGGG
jgi:thiamine biosynthesis protein ThiS